MEHRKKPCIVLTGPTAAGKTKLSIALAKAVNGSIISADSMQVYRRMNIGSAKITAKEMDGIPHYLVDVLEPSEEFNVFRFQELAREAMRKIYAQGRVPIIVGGTGFYIQALLRDVDFSESVGESPYRKELERRMENGEEELLFARLMEVDPESARIIHPHNHKRVIRALEYYHESGRPISEHNKEQHRRQSPYNTAYFVLTCERGELYRRIDARVDKMVKDGLFEEVQSLITEGLTEDRTSMKGLGYRELFPYFRGECTREEAIARIKIDTRHFAKRQLTWFRGEEDAIWLDKTAYGCDEERILSDLLRILKERNLTG
jgi:tRNA dimethylallyltransferase